MSVGIIREQSITFENGIKLDSGRILAPITLAYETYGTLNESASNAILVEHAWTGDAIWQGNGAKKTPNPAGGTPSSAQANCWIPTVTMLSAPM